MKFLCVLILVIDLTTRYLVLYSLFQRRATYDYEKKLRIEHYESLQVMEKNYMSMVREVEKLRAELTNANLDRSGAYIFLY